MLKSLTQCLVTSKSNNIFVSVFDVCRSEKCSQVWNKFKKTSIMRLYYPITMYINQCGSCHYSIESFRDDYKVNPSSSSFGCIRPSCHECSSYTKARQQDVLHIFQLPTLFLSTWVFHPNFPSTHINQNGPINEI